MKYRLPVYILTCFLFMSCVRDLYQPEDRTVAVYKKNRLVHSDSRLFKTIKSYDSKTVRDSYTNHEIILSDYVLFKTILSDDPRRNPKNAFLSTTESNEIMAKFITAVEKLDIPIKNQSASGWLHQELRHNFTLVPEYIRNDLIFNFLKDKDDRTYIIPIISQTEYIYNLEAFSHLYFEFKNCMYVALFIVNKNEIFYNKTSYMCNIAHDRNPDYFRKVTELNQPEWDLLVYELMREYLERVE